MHDHRAIHNGTMDLKCMLPRYRTVHGTGSSNKTKYLYRTVSYHQARVKRLAKKQMLSAGLVASVPGSLLVALGLDI